MLRRPDARTTLWLATLILLVAALLRLTDITTLAHGLHYDEAAYVLNIRDIAYNGDRPIFVRAFVGREVGFLYWAAPWLMMADNATWGTRLASAMLSLIGIAATFSMTRSLFAAHPQRNAIALIAAFWLAVSIAPLIFARYGYRAGSQPVVQALVLMALWRGMNTGRWRWFAAAGVFLGLVAYTYLAARLFPIPVALALLVWLAVSARRGCGQHLARVGLMGLVAAIVFAPLGWFFIQNPDIFSARLDQVSGSAGWREVAWAWWQCWLGLFLPNFGDPNVRYNLPGLPLSGEVFSLFGLIGVITLLIPQKTSEVFKTSEVYATRALLLSGLVIMLVPSALAVKDIIPSNIRMIGVWTFLAPVIGYGGVTLFNGLHSLLPPHTISRRWLQIGLMGGAAMLSLLTWNRYSRWNHSPDLFVATDGNMTVIGQDLQRRSVADVQNTTLYVASIHYQSPTVAALTQRFGQVKWLTGGATLVLPPKGDALYYLPTFVDPPAPYSTLITSRWQTDTLLTAPDGVVAARVMRLREADIAAIRAQLPAPAADFAHIVKVRDAQKFGECHVQGPCVATVIWEPMAQIGQPLQLVARLFHAESGEWVRANPFHYPTADWTVGEIVFDQIELPPPTGTPPVGDYQIGISFFNPNTKDVPPRVGPNEQFAGLELVLPFGKLSAPLPRPPVTAAVPICSAAPYTSTQTHLPNGATLSAWQLRERTLNTGALLNLDLCWQGAAQPMPNATFKVQLLGPSLVTLFDGAPARARLPFAEWPPNLALLDRYQLRLPRNLAAGDYQLQVLADGKLLADLGAITVNAPPRNFAVASPQVRVGAVMGGVIELAGFDMTACEMKATTCNLQLALHWHSLQPIEQDYVVFVHLIDPKTGRLVAQNDGQPLNGAYPTSRWAAGEWVRDERMLGLDNVPLGQYQLRVGFYLPYSGERLLVGGQGWWAGVIEVR